MQHLWLLGKNSMGIIEKTIRSRLLLNTNGKFSLFKDNSNIKLGELIFTFN